MKTNVFIAALMLVFLSVPAGFAWTSTPGCPIVATIAVDSSGSRILINIKEGGYWMTHDGGGSWEAINYQMEPDHRPSISQGTLFADASADTIITRSLFTNYPSGTYIMQQVLMSIDGGDSWYYPFENPMTNSSELMTYDRNDSDHLLYISRQYVFDSRDFGESWTSQYIDPHFNQKTGVYQDCYDDDSFYVTTFYSEGYDSGIFRSTNDGQSWSTVLPHDTPYTGFAGTVVMDIDHLSNGNLLASIPDGIGWTPDDDVFISSFLRSEDNGETWSVEYNLPLGYRQGTLTECPNDPGHLFVQPIQYIHVRSGYLLESLDYGNNWMLNTENQDALLNVSDIHVNRHSGTISIASYGNGCWYTTDLGASWQAYMLPADVGGKSFFSIREDFISSSEAHGRHAYYSHEGDDWTQVSYPAAPPDSSQVTYPLLAVTDSSIRGMLTRRCYENETGYMAVVTSHDGGSTWEYNSTYPIGTREHISGLLESIDSEQHYTIYPHEAIDGSWSVLISDDNGLSWQTVELGITEYLVDSYYAVRDNYLYAVHNQQGVFRIPLDGGDWEDLNHPNPDYLSFPNSSIISSELDEIYVPTSVHTYVYQNGEWTVAGVLPYPECHFSTPIPRDGLPPALLMTSTQSPHVYASQDGGFTWDQADPPLHEPQMIRTFDIRYDPWRERVWLNTPLGLQWEDASAFTSVDEEDAVPPDSPELLSVYPNPFNSRATVSVYLTAGGHATVTVYNSLGQEVATLADETLAPGAHSFTLDGSRLSSGSYFVRLNTRSEATVRKIELMK